MVKFLLKYVAAGAAIVFGMGVASAALPYLSGPVQQASDLPSIVNGVIQSVNNQLGYYLAFNNSTAETGEIALLNGNSFVANGSQTVTLGEGPTGINLGQPKQWLVIVDYNGRVGYVPEW